MQELKHNDRIFQYPEVIEEMKEKYVGIEGVSVEITEINNHIKLSYADNDLYITPEQAVDLMRELRRAVVKTNPKALRK